MGSEQLTAITKLLEACGLPFEDLTVAHMQDFIVLRDGTAVVGCVGLEVFGESGLLRSLAVAEGWRGRGFGRKLVHTIEQQATDRQINQLYLLTETAAQFFDSLGYQRMSRNEVRGGVRESAEFRTLCPDSAVCMTKLLA